MMLIASSPVWVGISSLPLHTYIANIYSVYIQSTIHDKATPKWTHFSISVVVTAELVWSSVIALLSDFWLLVKSSVSMWKVTKMGLCCQLLSMKVLSKKSPVVFPGPGPDNAVNLATKVPVWQHPPSRSYGQWDN